MDGGKLWLKALAVGLIASAFPLLIFGCKNNTSTTNPTAHDATWPDKPGPKVVVSFAPLYCFVANVAGEDAVVKNVMTSRGPHDFDPTEADMKLVTKADLFFIIGLGLDDKQGDKMKTGSGNKNLKLVELGESESLKTHLLKGVSNQPGHEGHDHGDKDPHLWLSPDHAVKLVNLIRDELKAADPAHAAGYESRAAAYVLKLNALKTYGLEKFKDKKDRRLVSFHDSLAYFSKAFNLEVSGVLTKHPGQEPDAKEMKQLIKVCTGPPQVRLITTEPQYSTSTSGQALQKELAAKGVASAELVEFDPLETVRPEDLTLDWYEKKMRENLDKLAEKMK